MPMAIQRDLEIKKNPVIDIFFSYILSDKVKKDEGEKTFIQTFNQVIM